MLWRSLSCGDVSLRRSRSLTSPATFIGTAPASGPVTTISIVSPLAAPSIIRPRIEPPLAALPSLSGHFRRPSRQLATALTNLALARACRPRWLMMRNHSRAVALSPNLEANDGGVIGPRAFIAQASCPENSEAMADIVAACIARSSRSPRARPCNCAPGEADQHRAGLIPAITSTRPLPSANPREIRGRAAEQIGEHDHTLRRCSPGAMRLGDFLAASLHVVRSGRCTRQRYPAGGRQHVPSHG